MSTLYMQSTWNTNNRKFIHALNFFTAYKEWTGDIGEKARPAQIIWNWLSYHREATVVTLPSIWKKWFANSIYLWGCFCYCCCCILISSAQFWGNRDVSLLTFKWCGDDLKANTNFKQETKICWVFCLFDCHEQIQTY